MSQNKQITINKGGRPTKYTPAVLNRIDGYFQTVGREQTQLPTIEGFAEYLGIATDTVWRWSKKYKDFSDTVKKVVEKQKKQLMDDGMYGGKEVNAAMAIFLLKANHGMSDGSNTTINVSVKPILGGATVEDVEVIDEKKEVQLDQVQELVSEE